MWNRSEVPIACYFTKRGSGGLLCSEAREKLDQRLTAFEDPRRKTEAKSAKRGADGLTPLLGPATPLNLELILLDDRRRGTETKYR